MTAAVFSFPPRFGDATPLELETLFPISPQMTAVDSNWTGLEDALRSPRDTTPMEFPSVPGASRRPSVQGSQFSQQLDHQGHMPDVGNPTWPTPPNNLPANFDVQHTDNRWFQGMPPAYGDVDPYLAARLPSGTDPNRASRRMSSFAIRHWPEFNDFLTNKDGNLPNCESLCNAKQSPIVPEQLLTPSSAKWLPPNPADGFKGSYLANGQLDGHSSPHAVGYLGPNTRLTPYGNPQSGLGVSSPAKLQPEWTGEDGGLFDPFSPKCEFNNGAHLYFDDFKNMGTSQYAGGFPEPVKEEPEEVFKRQIRPVKPAFNPDRPWNRPNATTKGLNISSAKMIAFDPRKAYAWFYQQAAARSDLLATSWGRFNYTQYGELQEGRRYSVKEMREYLFNHPLHTENGVKDPTNGRLTLWIQVKPAQMDFRYINRHSSKCRLRNCAAINNTIAKGDYQVCFDEQTWKKQGNDPLVSAAWVHLYCLERYLDLPEIMRTLNVRVDARELKNETNETNNMSVAASRSAYMTAKSYIKRCRSGKPIMEGPKDGTPFDKWLTCMMMKGKRSDEPISRLTRQTKPTHWPQLLGNLELARDTRQAQRRENRERNVRDHYGDSGSDDDDFYGKPRKKRNAAMRSSRRKRCVIEDSDDEDQTSTSKDPTLTPDRKRLKSLRNIKAPSYEEELSDLDF